MFAGVKQYIQKTVIKRQTSNGFTDCSSGGWRRSSGDRLQLITCEVCMQMSLVAGWSVSWSAAEVSLHYGGDPHGTTGTPAGRG